MPRFTLPALENEIGQRVVTAASAAAMTYIRPARFPKWVRRSITMSNSLTAVGAALAGNKAEAANRQIAKDNVGRPAAEQTLTIRDGKTATQAGANWASAASAGMALVTSGVALAVDKRVERFLISRGVKNPRAIMAVGAAAISLAGPWITKKIQVASTQLQEKALPKDVLEQRLADPLGQTAPKQNTLAPGASATSNVPDESATRETESANVTDVDPELASDNAGTGETGTPGDSASPNTAK